MKLSKSICAAALAAFLALQNFGSMVPVMADSTETEPTVTAEVTEETTKSSETTRPTETTKQTETPIETSKAAEPSETSESTEPYETAETTVPTEIDTSKYEVTSGTVVEVEYEGGVRFLLNFNSFDVTTEFEGTEYTIEAMSFIRIG